MLPALGGVLLLHAALLYGITRSEPVQIAGGDDVPISVDIVEAPYQPPVIPEPSTPPRPSSRPPVKPGLPKTGEGR